MPVELPLGIRRELRAALLRLARLSPNGRSYLMCGERGPKCLDVIADFIRCRRIRLGFPLTFEMCRKLEHALRGLDEVKFVVHPLDARYNISRAERIYCRTLRKRLERLARVCGQCEAM
jgi:hypothetical protein